MKQNVLLLDTFSGMPAPSIYDAGRSAGEFVPAADQAAILRQQATKLGVADQVKVHCGLFSETFAALNTDPLRFAFAHIDANIYSSTLEACEFVMPRMNEDGAVVFDDYNGVCDLGARLAIDRYFRIAPNVLNPWPHPRPLSRCIPESITSRQERADRCEQALAKRRDADLQRRSVFADGSCEHRAEMTGRSRSSRSMTARPMTLFRCYWSSPKVSRFGSFSGITRQLGANTNAGLRESQGEFACFLHQDDTWLPGRLRGAVTAIHQNSSIRLWLQSCRFIDPKGRTLGKWTCPLPGHVGGVAATVMGRLLVQNWIGIPAPLFRREDALAVGGLDEAPGTQRTGTFG